MKTVIAEQDMGLLCDEKRCTRQACYIVAIHQIHDCGADECNEYGDRVFLLCPGHTKESLLSVFDIIADADETCCRTCDLDITVLHNVIASERLLTRNNAEIQA